MDFTDFGFKLPKHIEQKIIKDTFIFLKQSAHMNTEAIENNINPLI